LNSRRRKNKNKNKKYYNLESSHIFGPFLRLPLDLQKKTLDILYYFDSFSIKLVQAITSCCNRNFFYLFIFQIFFFF